MYPRGVSYDHNTAILAKMARVCIPGVYPMIIIQRSLQKWQINDQYMVYIRAVVNVQYQHIDMHDIYRIIVVYETHCN